jgi:hypothetical protein
MIQRTMTAAEIADLTKLFARAIAVGDATEAERDEMLVRATKGPAASARMGAAVATDLALATRDEQLRADADADAWARRVRVSLRPAALAA